MSPTPTRPAVLRVATFASAALLASVARGTPPYETAITSPGRALASVDDSSAIALNPANLALLPGPELRVTTLGSAAAVPLPNGGQSFAVAAPFLGLATGLRVDRIHPPSGVGTSVSDPASWLRWGLAARIGRTASIGTTVAWSRSDVARWDGAVSVTSAFSWQPASEMALSLVARDWNEPRFGDGDRLGRSLDAALALRPLMGRRAFELGFEVGCDPAARRCLPRTTMGVDVPRLGRLLGDVALVDAVDPHFAVGVALDLNAPMLQLGGGALFGSARGASGAGLYGSAALRGYREPGARVPARVARIRLAGTPGVRAHTLLLRKLWRLAEDPETEAVLLVLRAEPASSFAHAEELDDAIQRIRGQGKKVVCHLEDAGARSLFACAHADRIAMNPAGGLRFAGLANQYFYLGGLLEKLGVRADFVRIGDHKSAAEQFTREHGTKVAEADHAELLREFEKVFLTTVGAGRRIAPDELASRIAKGPFLASEARDAGLIDVLAFDDEVGRVVEETVGHPTRILDDDPVPSAPAEWGNPGKVAIVYLDGDMIDGESRRVPVLGVRLAGSYTVASALKNAREDASVKAVVLRVETGGGSSLAADVILREAILTAQQKPLVVSMGSAAASGGYYASVAGRRIFADRATVTGSIGIFYGKADVSGLLDRLGVHVDAVRTAPRADAESLFRPFTDDEREVLAVKVKQFYDLFVARVAEGRRMTPDAVDAIGRGKVWSGAQASERGLVDSIGGLREAIDAAIADGGLPLDAPVVELPVERPSLLGRALELAGVPSLRAGASVSSLALLPPPLFEVARAMTPFFVFDTTRPLARSEFVGDSAESSRDDDE